MREHDGDSLAVQFFIEVCRAILAGKPGLSAAQSGDHLFRCAKSQMRIITAKIIISGAALARTIQMEAPKAQQNQYRALCAKNP